MKYYGKLLNRLLLSRLNCKAQPYNVNGVKEIPDKRNYSTI